MPATHSRRPRIFMDPESVVPRPKFIGRPLIRWISWFCVCTVTLWMLIPLVVNFTRSPAYEYDPPVHHRPSRPHLGAHPQVHLTVWSGRAERVREAFVHAYSGYQKHAFPWDELLPVTGGRVNNFNGWGLTLFDSMDTMWIMGLSDLFTKSLDAVASSTFFLKQDSYAPFFETVIRYLGGLLSAYALSGESILLARADDLGKMLLPAFNTTSGLPVYALNTVTNGMCHPYISGDTRAGWSGNVLWAEALSNQVEYKYLAHLTGRPEYYAKTEHIMRLMYDANVTEGMFPTMWDINTGTPKNTHFSVGAYADSAHEYLLKQWLVTGKSELKTRDLYLRSINAIINNLLYVTPKRNLLYVTDTHEGIPTHIFEHLSCFLPGLLALGVHTLNLPPRDKELHSWAAEGLAHTCWISYADQVTGLGPDEMKMMQWEEGSSYGSWIKHVTEWDKAGRPLGVPPGLREPPAEKDGDLEYVYSKSTYLLRPETVETFYILWRTTGAEKWRDRGWSVFEAIEEHTRTTYGYASIAHVNKVPVTTLDEMPSYFLAETLKYLFLLFTDYDIIPLKNWVFNTEAHPIPVFEWRSWERARYNISNGSD